ncbi:sugar ABC transporter ATP-binding protein [Anaerofilum sp. BX8]|uniref:Sugar ABC transporter ATP-binding protein n=2 Tax=Anaerofilum hominis TaxID=2763016 RepID=A0A923L254_9FIRM|nr:sugar ABC transporter ATP-binding protein [Anaerofilum hominis]MBC5582470.1 sugar ABC transporter ATP-binding protein [Anaerofilum hominis]
MTNIHKRFPGVYALKGAKLRLKAGEVHALVGENGSGKSTLLNVLGGILSRDEGEIRMNGEAVEIQGVLDAQRAGISIIHQELVLVPYLSIAENIYINREPMKNGMVDYGTLYENAQKFIDELGLDLDAREKVVRLTIAQQQMVEIVKAVSFNAKIVAMDEPTSSLSDKEIDALFANIRSLKARGIGVIYISHRLSELTAIADTVTVLRDGEMVATKAVSETNNDEIVRLMVGREVTNYYTRTYNPPGETMLKVEGLSSNKVKDVSFEVHRGEILGFAGLVGAGRTETMKAILGLDERTKGRVTLLGKPLDAREPMAAYRRGIAYIPENRREEGIIPLQTIRFNMTLKVLGDFIKGIRVDRSREREITDRYIRELSVKTPSQLARLQNLSGGNQQKVIIASWLAARPELIIMDEPTRGIDVGAKAEIYALMNDLARQGIAIIMISSELPEIINMSDRVVVMREGTVSRVLERPQLSQEEIMKYAVNI